jgi:hypothetical protein
VAFAIRLSYSHFSCFLMDSSLFVSGLDVENLYISFHVSVNMICDVSTF